MQASTSRYDIETLPFYDDTLDYDDVYEVPHTVYSDDRPGRTLLHLSQSLNSSKLGI